MALSRLEKVQVWLFKAFMGVLFALFRLCSPLRAGVSGKKLPPVGDPLLLLSATQLAKKIRRKEVCTRPKRETTAAGRRSFDVFKSGRMNKHFRIN